MGFPGKSDFIPSIVEEGIEWDFHTFAAAFLRIG